MDAEIIAKAKVPLQRMLDFSYGYQKSEINFHVESPFGSIEREQQFMSILENEKLQCKLDVLKLEKTRHSYFFML
nr:hypothetical protein [Candidatus Coxiella mudrowiae]